MSGSGSNARTLLGNEQIRDLYDMSVVWTDNQHSNAAQLAGEFGLDVAVRHIDKFSDRADREAYFTKAQAELGRLGVQIVLYAGFMKIATPAFCEAMPGVNAHPADLTIVDPDTNVARYRGMRALPNMRGDLGYVASTLHVVDTPVDTGSSIAVSSRVDCLPAWSDEECHAALKAHEHQLYPTGLALLAGGTLAEGMLPLRMDTETRT